MPSSRSFNLIVRGGLAASLVLALLAMFNVVAQPNPASASAPAAPVAQDATARYFPETQHVVSGPLLTLYDKLGGAARWGVPLTEQYDDSGLTTQIFEYGALQYDAAHTAGWARALGSEQVAGHAAQPPVQASADGVYVAETGHNVGPAFAGYWKTYNATGRLGRPISEQMNEGTHVVQYFEFARLSVDPSAPEGVRQELQDNVRVAGSPFAPIGGASGADSLFVPATGHSIAGGFLEVYNTLGGAETFGAPLTEEVQENAQRVQYFAAAKLSWDASRPAGQQVQLESLGKIWMDAHAVPAAALQQQAAPPTAVPAPPTATAAPSATAAAVTATPVPAQGTVAGVPAGWQLVGKGSTTYKGSSGARVTNLSLAARKLDGKTIPAGAVFSFNNALGDDSEKAGFVEGLVILNGRTVPGVGGGICQTASTFFRAAFYSGFDIIERHPHSYRVSWYEPPVGFDATVFRDEGVDLRFRNNLSAPVLIRTYNDMKSGILTVAMYSQAQQSATYTLDGPYTSNRVPHGPAIYENNPKLPKGTVQQVEHAKDGLDTVIYRVVTDKATGKVLRRDKFFSRYQPWQDVYERGTGGAKTSKP